jgi:hypothetical protein
MKVALAVLLRKFSFEMLDGPAKGSVDGWTDCALEGKVY